MPIALQQTQRLAVVRVVVLPRQCWLLLLLQLQGRHFQQLVPLQLLLQEKQLLQAL